MPQETSDVWAGPLQKVMAVLRASLSAGAWVPAMLNSSDDDDKNGVAGYDKSTGFYHVSSIAAS